MNISRKPMKASRRQSFYSRAKQRGMGVLDIILWVGAFIVIVAFIQWMRQSGWAIAQGWMESMTVSSAMDNVDSIYSGSASYNGLTTAGVANTNVFNAKYLPGGGVILNRFGGSVTVTATTTTNTDDTQVYTDPNVSTGACATLVNDLVDNVDTITVAGTVVKASGAAVNSTTLNTQCTSATSVTVIVSRLKAT